MRALGPATTAGPGRLAKQAIKTNTRHYYAPAQTGPAAAFPGAIPYLGGMSSSALTLTPRPDLGILVARWADDAPTALLQDDYAALLAVAHQHQLARWLLDVRRRDQLNPELGEWTTHVFYPQAAGRLAPLPLRIAVHCSPGRLSVYQDDPDQQRYLDYGLAADRPYKLHLFIEEGPAIDWLVS